MLWLCPPVINRGIDETEIYVQYERAQSTSVSGTVIVVIVTPGDGALKGT